MEPAAPPVPTALELDELPPTCVGPACLTISSGAPQLAPNKEIADAITSTLTAIKYFAARVHKGEIASPDGKFRELLVIGIGGSALGPQLVSYALGRLKAGRDKMRVHFFDNTDPDGIDYVLKEIGSQLRRTLVVVISKSGGTFETRNGILEAAAVFKARGLKPA